MKLGNGRHRSGFSLVELLVTLVIVAILLVLLLPVLRQVRGSARQVTCMTQQRGNAKSTLLYVDRNKGQFPPLFFSFAPGSSGRIVVTVVPRTANAAGLGVYSDYELVCPSDTSRGTVPVLPEDGGAPVGQPVSYGYNIDLPLHARSYPKLRSADGRMVLYDGSMSGPGGGHNVQGSYPDSFHFVESSMLRRHDGGANVVFADWHVERLEEVSAAQVSGPPLP